LRGRDGVKRIRCTSEGGNATIIYLLLKKKSTRVSFYIQ
jgi:hypothetical protein